MSHIWVIMSIGRFNIVGDAGQELTPGTKLRASPGQSMPQVQLEALFERGDHLINLK